MGYIDPTGLFGVTYDEDGNAVWVQNNRSYFETPEEMADQDTAEEIEADTQNTIRETRVTRWVKDHQGFIPTLTDSDGNTQINNWAAKLESSIGYEDEYLERLDRYLAEMAEKYDEYDYIAIELRAGWEVGGAFGLGIAAGGGSSSVLFMNLQTGIGFVAEYNSKLFNSQLSPIFNKNVPEDYGLGAGASGSVSGSIMYAKIPSSWTYEEIMDAYGGTSTSVTVNIPIPGTGIASATPGWVVGEGNTFIGGSLSLDLGAGLAFEGRSYFYELKN